MTTNGLLSREIAAGYDPQRLAAMRVLLIGAGALGQNLGQNLALSQVGQLWLVDYDQFERHNATRSPCYPTRYERRRWGNTKAEMVAKKLRKEVWWSARPRISYLAGPIQQFGDSVFKESTVVVSAVDSNSARAYIGAMCRKHRLPLVEGGFQGPDVSFCVIANDPSGPCWLCHQAIEVVDHLKLSCTAQALKTEKAGFVPATQPAAAALGALMAEAVIQLGHGDQEIINRRVYANIRTARAIVVRLAADEKCHGRHAWPEPSFDVCIGSESAASELLAELSKRLTSPTVMLPHRFVAAAPCADCLHVAEVHQPEWAVARRPLCQDCGGPWPRRNGTSGGVPPLEVHLSFSADTPQLLGFPLRMIGIAPGSVLEVASDERASLAVVVSGSVSLIPV